VACFACGGGDRFDLSEAFGAQSIRVSGQAAGGEAPDLTGRQTCRPRPPGNVKHERQTARCPGEGVSLAACKDYLDIAARKGYLDGCG
jgi:hypothetical protein